MLHFTTIADHQGSKIPLREFRWIGSYGVEEVLSNESYIVRKLNSNKTQFLHRTELRKYEPKSVLKDERPEGILQPDEEIIIPQVDLNVITWETEFGDFPTPSLRDKNSFKGDFDQSYWDRVLTDVTSGPLA